jgi:hypothetical protein
MAVDSRDGRDPVRRDRHWGRRVTERHRERRLACHPGLTDNTGGHGGSVAYRSPNLDGTWTVTSCDLQLFVGGGDLSTLVAAVQVKNTGNVPALITVSLKWDALPGPLIDGGTKQVRLNPDGTREIRFTKTRLNTDDVSRVQSSPGYKSSSEEKLCKVKTSIDYA